MFEFEPGQAFGGPKCSLASSTPHFDDDLTITTPPRFKSITGNPGAAKNEVEAFIPGHTSGLEVLVELCLELLSKILGFVKALA